MPGNGPRTLPSWRSASTSAAIANASGFVRIRAQCPRSQLPSVTEPGVEASTGKTSSGGSVAVRTQNLILPPVPCLLLHRAQEPMAGKSRDPVPHSLLQLVDSSPFPGRILHTPASEEKPGELISGCNGNGQSRCSCPLDVAPKLKPPKTRPGNSCRRCIMHYYVVERAELDVFPLPLRLARGSPV